MISSSVSAGRERGERGGELRSGGDAERGRAFLGEELLAGRVHVVREERGDLVGTKLGVGDDVLGDCEPGRGAAGLDLLHETGILGQLTRSRRPVEQVLEEVAHECRGAAAHQVVVGGRSCDLLHHRVARKAVGARSREAVDPEGEVGAVGIGLQERVKRLVDANRPRLGAEDDVLDQLCAPCVRSTGDYLERRRNLDRRRVVAEDVVVETVDEAERIVAGVSEVLVRGEQAHLEQASGRRRRPAPRRSRTRARPVLGCARFRLSSQPHLPVCHRLTLRHRHR